MRNFVLPILTLLATVCDFTSAVNDCLVGGSNDKCQYVSSNTLDLSNCQITGVDLADVSDCINNFGGDNIHILDLSSNGLTTLSAGIFDSLTAVTELSLKDNFLPTLPTGIFDSLALTLERLVLDLNELATLPAGIFASLTSLLVLDLGRNELTTLPAGIFDSLTSLTDLDLAGNALECVPPTATGIAPLVNAGVDECESTPEPACGDGVDLCDDPHMKGLSGQKIDWSGVNGGWYCLVQDDEADLQVNVRLTAPLPEDFPERQLVTGLSVISGDHSLVVEVTNPYETHMNDGCPDGVSTPCLANGGLSVTVNGEKDMVDYPFLHPVRGEILPGGSMEVSAANLPVECWEFGGDAIWARHYADMMAQGRRTESGQSFEDWVLSFDHMAAHDWCTENITKNGLSGVQSSHAIFQIVTPAIVVRLNVGVGHQIGGELDWDGRVLPDLDVWQMDVGLVGLSVENESLTGILGETARPVYDKDGHAVMSGDDAFRGAVEDYRVSDGLGTDFALLHPN